MGSVGIVAQIVIINNRNIFKYVKLHLNYFKNYITKYEILSMKNINIMYIYIFYLTF